MTPNKNETDKTVLGTNEEDAMISAAERMTAQIDREWNF